MSFTVVILHGWGHNSSAWTQIKDMLEKDYPVVVLDLPGFGDEPIISKDATIPDYADWVVKRIETIEGDKIILGHSFGGRIGSLVASRNPVWLKGLILYGAPCIYRPTQKIKLKIMLAKIIKKCNLRKYFERFYNSDLRDADGHGMGALFRRTVSFDQTSILPNISAPTLLVWGENDTAAPLRIAKEIKTLIPNSTLEVIPHVGHNAHIENTYLFYGIVKNFLKNL